MSSLRSLLCVFVALCAIHFAEALYFTPTEADQNLLSSYDYIIVGGGASGLTVARRLSEDSSVKVLVVEAGFLDTNRDLSANGLIAVPGTIGVPAPYKGMYYWNFTTAPQQYLSNRAIPFSQARAVGGGTLLNGLCWTRGAASDFDAWRELGNPGWGWSDLLPYFIKSEKFTDSNVPAKIRDELHIDPDNSAHGTDGPVSVSWPNYIYNQTSNLMRAWIEVGVPANEDNNNGHAAGAYVLPSSMDSVDQSRSDARAAHFDPIHNRPNLHILTQMRVTKLLWAPKSTTTTIRRISGVTFSESSTSKVYSISASREIVLAAGAIWTPTLLQVSGIGPRWYLEQQKIGVGIDLSGVGYNFQDHPMVHASYTYQNKSVFTASQITGDVYTAVSQEYINHRTGPWTAPLVNTVAFPSLSTATKDPVGFYSNRVLTAKDNLPKDTPPSVRLGYQQQKALIKDQILSSDVGLFEVLATSNGQLTVAAMKTLSRGTVRPANSKSMWEQPVFDPRYCSNNADCEVLTLALQFNKKTVGAQAMKPLQCKFQTGFNTYDHDSLMGEAKSRITTEFHPSGTAAMMPRQIGGVVDSNLIVYGTSNLRVVDASIFPIIPAGHLQAVVYAVAEKASDLIKGANFVDSGSSATTTASTPVFT
ncbi:Fc.00g078680.m01.CDS01 [Cosmosporella sp. VM-42]